MRVTIFLNATQTRFQHSYLNTKRRCSTRNPTRSRIHPEQVRASDRIIRHSLSSRKGRIGLPVVSSITYRPRRADRSLPAAISNIRTNIYRAARCRSETRSEPVPGWCRCYDDGTRISFCASATFVFTTPPITLTRNERGMRADAPSGRTARRDSSAGIRS